jgi:hypothetical protein
LSNEFTIRSNLSARSGSIDYTSRPTSFRADLEGAVLMGPTPGAVAVSTEGTDISLAQLSDPGYCHIRNIDTVNDFQWGVWDPETSRFYPVGHLKPGQSVVFCLARDFGEEYTNTGTGTTAGTNRLRCKAIGGASVALIECFSR